MTPRPTLPTTARSPATTSPASCASTVCVERCVLCQVDAGLAQLTHALAATSPAPRRAVIVASGRPALPPRPLGVRCIVGSTAVSGDRIFATASAGSGRLAGSGVWMPRPVITLRRELVPAEASSSPRPCPRGSRGRPRAARRSGDTDHASNATVTVIGGSVPAAATVDSDALGVTISRDGVSPGRGSLTCTRYGVRIDDCPAAEGVIR